MFKKFLLAIAIIVPMFASAQTLKIGLVDFNAILDQMPEMTEAKNKIAETSNKYEAEYTKLGEEMKRLYDEYQNMKEDELPAIRERKTRELSDYQQKLQQFEQNAMQDLQRMQMELTAPITSKINQAVQSVGQEGNYSLIQVKEQQLTLYYASPVEDITPLVKAKLGLK